MKDNAKFAEIWDKAYMAGMAAGHASKPAPMIVAQHANPLDDRSAVEKAWYVPDGPCGFASVIVKPATSSFAKWVKATKGGSKNYNGGLTAYWVREFGQSMARKEDFAYAFAKVLNDYGITAYVDSRMD